MPPKSKKNALVAGPAAAVPAPQIQVPPERQRPVRATPDQIRRAIEVTRKLPYGPNLNPNDEKNKNHFASCIEVTSCRFIAQEPREELQAKTTVTFIAGEHSGIIGIFQGVQDTTESRAFPIIDVEIPDVSTVDPIPVEYILGTLLNKALLGEDILVELQQILETKHGLSTKKICELLNKAFERLQDVKGREVSEYIQYCEEQLKQRKSNLGEEECSNDSAFSPEFMKDVREFSKVFRIGAEYSPDFHGVPLKIIVFTNGSSDKYKINWSLVPTAINSNHVIATAFETFVSNTAFNFVFNVEVSIPGHGTFVINLSLNKTEFHRLFLDKCYMLLHDLISFLRMYVLSGQFKQIIIDEIKNKDETVHPDDNIAALNDTSLRIFDMGCAACREVVDVTVEPPIYSRLELDFFTRENTESRDVGFNTFRLLPSLGEINESRLPLGITRETLSTSQIAVHVPTGFSSAVVVSPFRYDILDTDIGDLTEDSMKRQQPESYQSLHDDAPLGNYENLTARDIQDIIGQMNGDIKGNNGKKICLKPVSKITKKQRLSDDPMVLLATKTKDIDNFLQQSQQILDDVNQLEQPQLEHVSHPPSKGILSVFSGLANLVRGLGSRLGFGGEGGGGGGIHKNITKTRNRRRKNKTKKRYRKNNKRQRKTYRLHKNHKHKIHKSHKK